jgi:hypothetical protein
MKSGFTSSAFFLSAVAILGVVASALTGTSDPKLMAIGAAVSAVYTACNAWLKVASEAQAVRPSQTTDIRLPMPSLPPAEAPKSDA